MAEEQEEKGGGTSIKSIIIGLISTITLGVGGFITTKLTGGGDDKEATPAAAPVINITNSNQQSQAAGKTVIINQKAAEPAKPQPAKPKKEADEFKEKPAAW